VNGVSGEWSGVGGSGGEQLYGEQQDLLDRLVCSRVRLHLVYALHDLHPLRHPTEDRVLPVEPRRRADGNEELRSVRVRARVRHAVHTHPTYMHTCIHAYASIHMQHRWNT